MSGYHDDAARLFHILGPATANLMSPESSVCPRDSEDVGVRRSKAGSIRAGQSADSRPPGTTALDHGVIGRRRWPGLAALLEGSEDDR